LMHVVADVELHEMFLVLAMMSSVVIACRCTPFQKAELVRMVKFSNSRQPLTLAIGDGANDVPMLQEAHVGVGIHGNEGTQAVRASDYSIAQFQFLRRLLLVHGYWNYQRIAMVVLYSFYKNIALVFSLFFYATANGFSGTSLYESFLASGWNLSFTTFPILALGVLDQCLPVSTLKKNPIVYAAARTDVLFTLETTLRWIATAVLHSATVYFLSWAILANSVLGSDGKSQGIYVQGTMINFCILLTVTYKVS
jgi:phospholipid-transporting ATPase